MGIENRNSVGVLPVANHRGKVWVFLLIAFGVVYFGSSWCRPLGNPDESRYTEIPREMVVTGDWLAPRLNGVLYFEKPPLFYWLQAASYRASGLNRISLRFWPGFFALATCGMCYWAGSRLYGRRSGVMAALVLASSLIYFALSQLIILDMAVSFFISAALMCYLVGIRSPLGSGRRWYFWSFYALIGLAVMTKGLMAIAIPGAIIFLWFLLLGQWRELRNLYLLSGAIIFCLIVLPWHIRIAMEHREWFDFYIIHEHFKRYLTDVSNRVQPFWFFFVFLPVGFVPWVFFLPSALAMALKGGWSRRAENREAWFLIIWAVFILLFFSISHSKLIPYILPAVPPLALLVGRYLASAVELSGGWTASLRWPVRLCALFLWIGALAIPVVGYVREEAGELSGGASMVFIVGALICALAGFGLWRLSLRGSKSFPIWIAFSMIAVFLVFNPVAARFQPPSMEGMARALKEQCRPGDEVYSYRIYFNELPLYLDRLVGVVDNVPLEHSFGLEWEDHSDRYIELQDLRQRWRAEGNRIYVMVELSREEKFLSKIEAPVYEWKRDGQVAVYTNSELIDKTLL